MFNHLHPLTVNDALLSYCYQSCPLARNVWALVRGKIQEWPTDTDIDLFGLFSRDCVECSIEDTEMWASYVDVGRLELYE